ncbi:MAG: phage tail assembly protein [Roseburia sp.]
MEEKMDNIKIEKKENDMREDDKLVVELTREYVFEGKKYSEIDLHGLEDLSAEDMISANRMLSRNGNTDFLQEMSLEYACVLASKGSDLPLEFYRGLKPRDAMRVKSRVTGFLYGAE